MAVTPDNRVPTKVSALAPTTEEYTPQSKEPFLEESRSASTEASFQSALEYDSLEDLHHVVEEQQNGDDVDRRSPSSESSFQSAFEDDSIEDTHHDMAEEPQSGGDLDLRSPSTPDKLQNDEESAIEDLQPMVEEGSSDVAHVQSNAVDDAEQLQTIRTVIEEKSQEDNTPLHSDDDRLDSELDLHLDQSTAAHLSGQENSVNDAPLPMVDESQHSDEGSEREGSPQEQGEPSIDSPQPTPSNEEPPQIQAGLHNHSEELLDKECDQPSVPLRIDIDSPQLGDEPATEPPSSPGDDKAEVDEERMPLSSNNDPPYESIETIPTEEVHTSSGDHPIHGGTSESSADEPAEEKPEAEEESDGNVETADSIVDDYSLEELVCLPHGLSFTNVLELHSFNR